MAIMVLAVEARAAVEVITAEVAMVEVEAEAAEATVSTNGCGSNPRRPRAIGAAPYRSDLHRGLAAGEVRNSESELVLDE